ncbi:MAG: hypothetical protein CSA42_01170 [Gammaproteobacteria bacterium]|nr:MAG: hypothetical protein CSA42_01170 [Gammaproteobacteria bacterium]
MEENKEYYINGHLQSVGKYETGQEIGEWKYSYENGQLWQIGSFENSEQRKGEWRYYDENGKFEGIKKY